MASPSNFKAAVDEGINATESGASYLTNISGTYVSPIQELAKDFFSKGGISISQAIDDMENIDKEVEKTNFLYKKYEEKKTLMKEILDNMQKLQTLKTSMDPGVIQTACTTYNNNLYAAKWGTQNDKWVNFCKKVNSKVYEEGFRIRYNYQKDGKWTYKEKVVTLKTGRWNGESYKKENPSNLINKPWYVYECVGGGPYKVYVANACGNKSCKGPEASKFQQEVTKMKFDCSKYGAGLSISDPPAPSN